MALSRLWGHQTSLDREVKSPNVRGLRAGPAAPRREFLTTILIFLPAPY